MTHRPLRLAERVYGLLVDLYPRRFQQQFGWSMKQTFRDLLDDPDIPTSRIWLSVLRDLGSSLLHEHLANLTGGRSMTRFALPVGALRVAMLVVLIGATPLATGAVGYYLGRSQVQPVAESAFPVTYQTFYSVDGTKWQTPLICPVAIAPGVTARTYVFVEVTGTNAPRCPTALPTLINQRIMSEGIGVDVDAIKDAIRQR
jgi:hypothetical protein